MSNLIFVDCESDGQAPAVGHLTEFGAVAYGSRATFHGIIRDRCTSIPVPQQDPSFRSREHEVFAKFAEWLQDKTTGGPPGHKQRSIFVSDNPAFDWQWINDGFHRTLGYNPFGHSARRISDFYAGLRGDFSKTQEWKKLRVTPHDHNPVNDAMGNLEAFERILNGER